MNVLLIFLIIFIILTIFLIVYIIFSNKKTIDVNSDDLLELTYDYNMTEERLLAEEIINKEIENINIVSLFNEFPEKYIEFEDNEYLNIDPKNGLWKSDVYVLKNITVYFTKIIIENDKFSQFFDYEIILSKLEFFIHYFNKWIPYYSNLSLTDIEPENDNKFRDYYWNWEIFLVYVCKFFIYYLLWVNGKNNFKAIAAKNITCIIKIGSQDISKYLYDLKENKVNLGTTNVFLTSDYTITVNNCRIVGNLEGVSVIYLLIAYKFLYGRLNNRSFNIFSNYLTNIIRSLNDNLENSLNENYTLLYNVPFDSQINVLLKQSNYGKSIKLDDGLFNIHLSNIENSDFPFYDENIPLNVSIDNCLSLYRYFYSIELLSKFSPSLENIIKTSSLYDTIKSLEIITKHPTLYNSSIPLYIGDDYSFNCGLNNITNNNFGIKVIPSIKYLRLFTENATFSVLGSDITAYNFNKNSNVMSRMEQYFTYKFGYNGLINIKKEPTLILESSFKAGYLGDIIKYSRNIYFDNLVNDKFIGLIKSQGTYINNKNFTSMQLCLDSSKSFVDNDFLCVSSSCVFYDELNDIGISYLELRDFATDYKKMYEIILIDNNNSIINIHRQIINNTTDTFSHISNNTGTSSDITTISPNSTINIKITYNYKDKIISNFSSETIYDGINFETKTFSINEIIYKVTKSYKYNGETNLDGPFDSNTILYRNDKPIILCPSNKYSNINIIYEYSIGKFIFNKTSNQWLYIDN